MSTFIFDYSSLLITSVAIFIKLYVPQLFTDEFYLFVENLEYMISHGEREDHLFFKLIGWSSDNYYIIKNKKWLVANVNIYLFFHEIFWWVQMNDRH